MPYKRDNYTKRPEPHGLFVAYQRYDQLTMHKDPGWIEAKLEELHNDGHYNLNQLQKAIDRVKVLDLSEYRPEVARKKQAEIIQGPRRQMLSILKKKIDTAREDIAKVKNAILRVTEPPDSHDTNKIIRQELRLQELRSVLRQIDPKDRPSYIRQNADNPEFLHACTSSPDEIISPDVLEELRREYAFRQDPSLRNLENDTIAMYQATRRRAGEVNATSITMLNESKIDDPVTPPEHFEVFAPDTPYERYLADKRVRTYTNDLIHEEIKKNHEEHNKPLNFEPGASKKQLDRQRRQEHDNRA